MVLQLSLFYRKSDIMNDTFISKSEWRIMRILWSKPNLTSGEITSYIKKEKPLSVTTVKTQISSLMKKKFIKSKTTGRYPKYFPIVLELDMVQRSIQELVNSIYGDTLVKETAHFSYYGENNEEFVQMISVQAEGFYRKVMTFINHDEELNTRIYIYPTNRRLSSSSGVEDEDIFVSSAYNWGLIHLAPSTSYQEGEAIQNFKYSFMQILLKKINPELPFLLRQGISAYFVEELDKEFVSFKVKELYHELTFKDVLFTYGGKDVVEYNKYYELMYTWIHFLVAEYGEARLVDFIKGTDNYLFFIYDNRHHITEQWKVYIEKNFII